MGYKIKDGKRYQKLELGFVKLNEGINKLLKYGEMGLYYIDFDGNIFYSDDITVDKAYMKILGKTFKQFTIDVEKQRLEFQEEVQRFKVSIGGIKTTYIKKGEQVLDSDRLDDWNSIVPQVLSSMHRNLPLDCALDLVIMLNNGENLENVYKALCNQSHFGTSFKMTVLIVKEICKRGEDFVSFCINMENRMAY